ncbi:MAG: hypothetical protein FJW14_18750 [Acidimicrobiia bacterium]|nr:hypothetical protein [Acidimicrobiia bacterium]
MTIGRLVVLAVAAGLSLSAAPSAHHSSSAFDTGKKLVLKGVVKQWIYSNPHCFLMIEVKNDAGEPVQWVAETQAPSVIFPAGYRRDTFKPGEVVSVTVEPFKDGRPFGRILQTQLPDGTTLGVAGSPPAASVQAP